MSKAKIHDSSSPTTTSGHGNDIKKSREAIKKRSLELIVILVV